jgi:SAM-dependent methyltransferase
MPPIDATDGWDDDLNAEIYARFCRDYPFYTQTSQDLAARARLDQCRTAVDLCGGTGATAAVLLARMTGPGARVITVDSAKAMQRAGQRAHPDPRITWITATAEDAAQHIPEPAGAVVCNSAIWKTRTPAVFAAARRILRPGGRLVFNVGGGFAGLSSPPAARPTLSDLINLIAARDYGYVPPAPEAGPVLTPAKLAGQLAQAGFTVIETPVIAHHGTMEEKRAWLSIPAFARPPGRLTYPQRMEILRKAFTEADTSQPVVTEWLVITAEAPRQPDLSPQPGT